MGEFAGFGRVLECLGEIWSVWECFGVNGRDLERLGMLGCVWERSEAFRRLLDHLGEFWRV